METLMFGLLLCLPFLLFRPRAKIPAELKLKGRAEGSVIL